MPKKRSNPLVIDLRGIRLSTHGHDIMVDLWLPDGRTVNVITTHGALADVTVDHMVHRAGIHARIDKSPRRKRTK